MTSSGRIDVTSAEARAIHRQAQLDAAQKVGGHHDEVSCWCCCFDCDFSHAATIRNDQALGVPSVYS